MMDPTGARTPPLWSVADAEKARMESEWESYRVAKRFAPSANIGPIIGLFVMAAVLALIAGFTVIALGLAVASFVPTVFYARQHHHEHVESETHEK
jgi:hypothetical protein